MVDELTVECLNRQAGCDFTCQRQLLAAHLKDECLFTEEQCPDPDCSRKALRKDILGDNLFCPHRPVVCNSCGTELKALELGVSTLTLFSLNTIVFHPLAGTHPGVLHGDSQVPFLQCRTFAFRNCGSHRGVPCCNCGLRASLLWLRLDGSALSTQRDALT